MSKEETIPHVHLCADSPRKERESNEVETRRIWFQIWRKWAPLSELKTPELNEDIKWIFRNGEMASVIPECIGYQESVKVLKNVNIIIILKKDEKSN